MPNRPFTTLRGGLIDHRAFRPGMVILEVGDVVEVNGGPCRVIARWLRWPLSGEGVGLCLRPGDMVEVIEYEYWDAWSVRP